MKNQKHILISWIFSAFSTVLFAQATGTIAGVGEDDGGIRIMFYNVENLFDTFDDPAINDDEFTPEGEKNWNYYRYKEKLNKVAKIIIAVGGWEPPALIGLSEIENFQVLLDLTTLTPLKKFGYQIVHQNSDDRRGIDVAILYLPEKLTKKHHKSMKIESADFVTRDILYALFTTRHQDTIHFFVNHWPSRYGGKEFSENKRVKAASALKSATDSLFQFYEKPKIVVMGDFNDEPPDQSLAGTLHALAVPPDIVPGQLYNLAFPDYRAGKGTLVFKELDHTWFLFDQIIVSGAIIEGRGILAKGKKSSIFDPDWLMKNGRPSRTYQGPIYRGGFSDHLPIFLDLYYKK